MLKLVPRAQTNETKKDSVMEETKDLCGMCLRKKVNCGIMEFRNFPWQECKHFHEDEHKELECDGGGCKL